jgi:hypothetical protein
LLSQLLQPVTLLGQQICDGNTVLGVTGRFVDGRKYNVGAETGGRERRNLPALGPP